MILIELIVAWSNWFPVIFSSHLFTRKMITDRVSVCPQSAVPDWIVYFFVFLRKVCASRSSKCAFQLIARFIIHVFDIHPNILFPLFNQLYVPPWLIKELRFFRIWSLEELFINHSQFVWISLPINFKAAHIDRFDWRVEASVLLRNFIEFTFFLLHWSLVLIQLNAQCSFTWDEAWNTSKIQWAWICFIEWQM